MTIIEHMKNQVYPRQVGQDRIIRQGGRLVVCSNVDMDEWQVQGTRKTAIIIDDEVWCLVGKQYTDTNNVQYFLEPYSDYLSQLPGRRIRYDEEYVRTWEEADKKRKLEYRGDILLYPFKGIIGFLPSRLKAAIEKKFGIPAMNATLISIMIEFFIFVVFGFFGWVFYIFVPPLSWVYWIVPMLFVDLIFRYDSYFREDASPLGFYEWFFRFLYRRFN